MPDSLGSDDLRLSNARVPLTHVHAQGDVTGLTAALAAKQDVIPWLAQAFVQSGTATTGANTTPINVTNCVFAFVANGVYFIEVVGLTQAAAITTGHGFQFDTSVAVSFVALACDHALANTGTVTGGYSIADDASVGVSSGRPTINVNVPHKGAGLLVAGANAGTAQLRFRSEVAAAVSCFANILRVQRVA